jgi:hypothetical protein
VIKQQIEEAEATIAREVAEFEARYPPEAFAPEQPTQLETQPTKPTQAENQQPGEEQQQTNGRQGQPAPEHEADPTDAKSKETQGAPDTVGVDINDQNPDLAKTDEAAANVEESVVRDHHDAHRDDDGDDDGDEVVEDNEDTVIY